MIAVSKATMIAITILAFGQINAQIIVFEQPGFVGRSFSTEQRLPNREFTGFYERASSAIVMDDRWEVCDGARLGGKCSILRPGRYRSFVEMGLKGQLVSMRLINTRAVIDKHRYAPDPIPVYDNRRHNKEPLFEANISAARAIFGPPSGPCWIERDRVELTPSEPNAAGTIAGAQVGAILGHQMGGAYDQQALSIYDSVESVHSDEHIKPAQLTDTQNIQHCPDIDNPSIPEYWDVLYIYRGENHRIQMTTQPGLTVMVNRQGEPRS